MKLQIFFRCTMKVNRDNKKNSISLILKKGMLNGLILNFYTECPYPEGKASVLYLICYFRFSVKLYM